MNRTVEETPALSERLQPRIAIEQSVARGERPLRKRSLLLRYERRVLRPLLKTTLQLTGLYGTGVRNALNPVVRNIQMRFPHLPPGFDGFRILHISDLHIDGVDGLTENLVPLLRGLRPDLCVMTGDYRFEDEGPCDEVYPRLRSIVASISAKHGTFAILGNHDVSEIAFALEEMGVRMLVNHAVEISNGAGSIWLAGTDDDFAYKTHDLPAALAPVPESAFKVLLAHSPELYEDAADRGIDVYLCGHTHAGQIRFPKIGSLRHNAHCPKQYSFGQWNYRGMQGYTSAGTGSSSLPIRYNCPSELALIELRR